MYIQSPIYSDSDDGSVGDMEVDNTNNSGVETQDEVNTGFSLSNTESQSTESPEHTNKVSVKSTDTDYIVRVNKESFSTAVNTIATAIQNVGGPVLTNAGAGTAAGAVGTAVFQGTTSLPPVTRGAVVAGSVLVSAAAAKVGIDLGTAISQHTGSAIKNSPHADTNIDRIPSPEQFPNHSVIENTESIDTSLLYTLVRSDFILTLLISVLILSFLVLIFNRYVLRYNVEVISKFFSKRSKRISE